jgi:PAS domain S-box-containing protein
MPIGQNAMMDLPSHDPRTSDAQNANQELARCRAELEALRQSEAGWRDVFRRAPIAMSLTSAVDGRLREVNHRYAHLTGISSQELMGRRLAEIHLLPAGAGHERIAAELTAHEAVNEIAHYVRFRDGSMRPALSALQLITRDTEPFILSATVEATERSAKQRELSDLTGAQGLRVAELEAEIAAHRNQERRLIAEIAGLCTEASLLKSDIMMLKQMQQELSTEMDSLRKYAVHLTSASASAGPLAAAEPGAATPSYTHTSSTETTRTEQPVVAANAPTEGNGATDALWALAAARLQNVDEQLIKLVAALRAQAVSMQAGVPAA